MDIVHNRHWKRLHIPNGCDGFVQLLDSRKSTQDRADTAMAEDKAVSELHEAHAIGGRQPVEAAGERQNSLSLQRFHILGPRQHVRVLATDHRIGENSAGERTEDRGPSAGGLRNVDDLPVIFVDGKPAGLRIGRRRIDECERYVQQMKQTRVQKLAQLSDVASTRHQSGIEGLAAVQNAPQAINRAARTEEILYP